MTDLTFDATVGEPGKIPWAIVASLGLHVGLALAMILLSPVRDVVAPPLEPVAIEMVTEQQFATLRQAGQPPPVIATPTPGGEPARPAAAEPAPSGSRVPGPPETLVVTATEFYAAGLLRRPDLQRIRRGLIGFADKDRMVQICNIEALEQIRRAAPPFNPESVVAYAMSDLVWQGMTLTAAGGAFRSRQQWFGVAFHCTVAAGFEAVTAFDFKLGDAIPESDWDAHNLNREDASDD